MNVPQSPRLGVVRVATIRPADLALPVSRPIDISHLVASDRTGGGTG